MIKRIYIKLLAYLDQLLGLLHFYLEKYNFTELIVFQEVNKKNDVIQISNSYPINYKEKDKILFDEWKTYLTFENKLFFLFNVNVSYKGIISIGINCFVPALPHPVFKNNYGIRFNLHQNIFKKVVKFSDKEHYFIVHDMWSYANYYHWLVDSLTRLIFWFDELPKYSLLIAQDAPKYIKETICLFPFKKITEIPNNTYCHIPNLCVPNFTAWPGQQHPITLKKTKNFLLSHFNLNENKIERIYVSRAKQSRRKIANEELVLNLLKSYDFQIVFFEGMSISEQIGIVRNAKLMITSHGANVTNAMFMQNGKLLELIRIVNPNFCYWSMLTNLDIPYYYQLCELVNHDDLFVDIIELEKNIQALIK